MPAIDPATASGLSRLYEWGGIVILLVLFALMAIGVIRVMWGRLVKQEDDNLTAKIENNNALKDIAAALQAINRELERKNDAK
jgi:hypothetical protein